MINYLSSIKTIESDLLPHWANELQSYKQTNEGNEGNENYTNLTKFLKKKLGLDPDVFLSSYYYSTYNEVDCSKCIYIGGI